MLSGFAHGAAAWAALLAFGSLLLALAAAEAWRPLHEGGDEPRARIPGNVGLGVINAAIATILPVSSVIPAAWAAAHGVGLMNRIALPFALVALVTVLVRNLATYAVHRLSHALPLFWRVHRVHHADTRLDLSTGFRNHPLELAIVVPILAAISIGCGLDAGTLIVYEAVAVGFALWTHANLRLPGGLERALRRLLVTPAMHHVHHSSRRAETDSNYGDVLSLWDHLFGTYCDLPEETLRATRFGLGDAFDAGAPNLFHQLRSPLLALPASPDPSASEAGEEGGDVRAQGVGRIAALHQDQGRQA
ncbi:MAG TPA: sterol desaturase family protein [Allosphingosinicella sp.]|jgi:sterol desaturase/sphingolipid hydroxylase (fatty acid hydroxylase superfamily)